MIKKERQTNEKGESILVKRKLPLFTLSLANSEDINNIFKIKSIMGMIIRVEPLKKTQGIIPQCKKCQAFNHTQKYCNRETRCVKCAGKHDTRECQIDKSIPAKCINCIHGKHPASYRECEVAIEMQKLRNRNIKKQHIRGDKNKPVTKETLVDSATTLRRARVIDGLKYSQVVGGHKRVMPDSTEHKTEMKNVMTTMQNTLNAIVIRLTKIEENIESINNRQANLEVKFAKQDEFNARCSENFTTIDEHVFKNKQINK